MLLTFKYVPLSLLITIVYIFKCLKNHLYSKILLEMCTILSGKYLNVFTYLTFFLPTVSVL